MSAENKPISDNSAPLTAEDRALQATKQAWGRVGFRLRTITPSQFVRFLLVMAVIVSLSWLAMATWPALAPFMMGGGAGLCAAAGC